MESNLSSSKLAAISEGLRSNEDEKVSKKRIFYG